MNFRDDNTTIVNMKRDFDSFIHSHNEGRKVPRLNLDDSVGATAVRNAMLDSGAEGGALPVQALLDREKQIKRKDADLIAAKTQIVHLESKISSLETSNKRARIDLEHQIENIQREKQHESHKVETLEIQLKLLTEKESKHQEKYAEYQKELESQRNKHKEQILTLQKENIKLSEELDKEKESNWEKMTELRGEMMRNDTELKICKNELEETKAQLKLQQKRTSDISLQMVECEQYRMKAAEAEEKIKELQTEISRLEEDGLVGKAMKTQLATFQENEKQNRKLLDENKYLRETQENNLLLKEQHDSMKKKLERVESRLASLDSVVAENEELKSRLNQWEAVDKAGSKIMSPSTLNKRLLDLQNSEAMMLSKQGELQTSLKMKDNCCQSLQEQISSLHHKLAAEKSNTHQNLDLINRLKRKLLLVTKERDGYKRIIDSYESEVTVSLDPQSVSMKNRMQQLEESNEEYNKQTEFLDNELHKVNIEMARYKQHAKELEYKVSEMAQSAAMGSSQPSTTETDSKMMLTLREKIAKLEKALEKCEEDKYTLECRIEQRHLQGDYDPTKLKVLHFKMNPHDVATDIRKDELTKVKEENERLRERIKLLEENGGSIEDLTVAVEQKLKEPGSSKDIEEIRSQLSLAELQNKRLMEAFKQTSREVREVCYRLTGYKIDIPTPNQYRVTSMYAESPGDYLQFQQNSSGDIEMLGTRFSSSVQDLMETYLIQQDSIPAFLSGVTLELFSRQSMNFG